MDGEKKQNKTQHNKIQVCINFLATALIRNILEGLEKKASSKQLLSHSQPSTSIYSDYPLYPLLTQTNFMNSSSLHR